MSAKRARYLAKKAKKKAAMRSRSAPDFDRVERFALAPEIADALQAGVPIPEVVDRALEQPSATEEGT